MTHLSKPEQSILYTLRHTRSARYSDLQKPTGHESDTFKFHLRKLVKSEYVTKEGTVYTLTPLGKEFANNLQGHSAQKQPKISLFLAVSRTNEEGVTEYLVQERLRNPFYGYIGCISGPAKWGEEFEVTAADELLKQTGICADFRTVSFSRVRDYDTQQTLLEDKLFVILYAHTELGGSIQKWNGGKSMWLTLEQIRRMSPVFPQTTDFLSQLHTSLYSSQSYTYNASDY